MSANDRRVLAALMIAQAFLAVSACSSDTEEQSAPDAPPVFHFASGDLAIGEFYSDEVEGNLFDPCTGISAEEYAAAGITGVEAFDSEFGDPGVVMSCNTADPSAQETRRIMISAVGENTIKSLGGSQIEHPDSTVPGLYTVTEGANGGCAAQVDTERGALSISRWKYNAQGREDEVCRAAQKELEELYDATQQAS
ncbi:DUF3558 family protein [Corynebacterium gottingense]|uniref:DUF3558 family protein n=1 Tax=Corynebacterium TaxID=1716 RepID=UPI000BAA8548|nr:DUF3558 family protein [Corynebacterium hadale]PAT12328.1 hypothetical protein CKJ83_08490 [Corynebacterium hadale]